MVAVTTRTGIPLMPTTERNARRLIKEGKAVICSRFPFAIRLTERDEGAVQPVEACMDTGYSHIGFSIKSEKQESISAEFENLKDETERHNDQKKYRRRRRSRLRYRKARFDNRRKPDSWLAPSLENRIQNHIRVFERFIKFYPVTIATFEMGQFDTQLLKALENGSPIPEGVDYQRGERYRIATLREAVFSRDDYKCVVCGRTLKNNAVLHVHHLGYLKGDRSNRLDNLATVCEKCHTPKEHKEGGKLYGLKPKNKGFKGATFMTSVRWKMLGILKERHPKIKIRTTYGAMTKLVRNELKLEKSHANDAYAIGIFHPQKRAETRYYKKRRRNNRILEKFYDAKYIDSRDGSTRSGSQLFSGRSKRNKKTNTEDLHRYRSIKTSKGRRQIRRTHYQLRPEDVVIYNGEKLKVIGIQNNGYYIKLSNKKVVPTSRTQCLYHAGAWGDSSHRLQKRESSRQ